MVRWVRVLLSLNVLVCVLQVQAPAQDGVELVQLTKTPAADDLVSWEIRGAPAAWLVTNVEHTPVLSITSPNGKQWDRRAFLYQSCQPPVADGPPTAIGGPQLHIRHTARVAGKHTWVLRGPDHNELARGTLTVSAPRGKRPVGMLRVSQDNPRLLAFRDHTIFIPIGPNICWTVAPDQLGKFAKHFANLTKHGGNHVRLWCASWCGQIEGDQPDAYRLEQAWMMDRILALARQHGLLVTIVLDNHHDMGLGKFFPYGATYQERAQNFFNATPGDQYRRRLRYVLARWGADDSIAAWELFNELDLAQPVREAALQWASGASTVFKSLDADQRLLTISWAGDDWDPLAKLPAIDLGQVHSYVVEWSDKLSIRREATRDGVGMLLSAAERGMSLGKPYAFSEVGYQGTNEDNRGNELDTHGLLLRQQAWAGFMLGGYGSGMNWWWDVYIEPKQLWSGYRGLARVLPQIDWRDQELSPLMPNRDTPLRIIGWQSPTQALLWLQLRADTWHAHLVEGKPRPQLTRELLARVSGMNAGATYRLQYLDMLSGDERSRREVTASADGVLDIAVLPPNQDVVVRVTRMGK